jgi:hypothetical protein
LRLPSEPSQLLREVATIVPNGGKHWQGNSTDEFAALPRCCAEATSGRKCSRGHFGQLVELK